jgi:hypothetical protein
MYDLDSNLRVQFSVYPNFNQDKSNQAGRPIYDDAEYITIIVPGQQDIVFRKAWSLDRERFAKQYAAFKANLDQDAASGTPLKVLPWMQVSQIKELEFFHIRTVEQLANMPDSSASRFMGAQQLKQRAKDFIAAAKDAAPMLQMRTELEERDNKIEVLTRQMAELLARVDAAEAGKKAK